LVTVLYGRHQPKVRADGTWQVSERVR